MSKLPVSNIDPMLVDPGQLVFRYMVQQHCFDQTDQDILENTKEFANSLVDSTFLEDRPENREKFLSQVWTYVIDTAKELKGN